MGIHESHTLSQEFWIYSILGGMLGAAGNGFLIKALQSGELSVLGPINSYKSIVGMLIGILLLHEIPNVWGLMGIIIIIAGSYFVLDTTDEKFSWNIKKAGNSIQDLGPGTHRNGSRDH